MFIQTFPGDVIVTITWPSAVPSQSAAFFAAEIKMPMNPDHGHKTSEYVNPT